MSYCGVTRGRYGAGTVDLDGVGVAAAAVLADFRNLRNWKEEHCQSMHFLKLCKALLIRLQSHKAVVQLSILKETRYFQTRCHPQLLL